MHLQSAPTIFIFNEDVEKTYYSSVCPICKMENKSYHDQKGNVIAFPQGHNCLHYRGVFHDSVHHVNAFYSEYANA